MNAGTTLHVLTHATSAFRARGNLTRVTGRPRPNCRVGAALAPSIERARRQSMAFSTTRLGLPLPHPFMPGASPLVDDLDTVRRLEDAGAAAIVMHPLLKEQRW